MFDIVSTIAVRTAPDAAQISAGPAASSPAPEVIVSNAAVTPSPSTDKANADRPDRFNISALSAEDAEDADAAKGENVEEVETEGDAEREALKETFAQAVKRLFSELWRPQIDPETMRVFTEVVNPETRTPMYRLPPVRLSEQALAESARLSRVEYQELRTETAEAVA